MAKKTMWAKEQAKADLLIIKELENQIESLRARVGELGDELEITMKGEDALKLRVEKQAKEIETIRLLLQRAYDCASLPNTPTEPVEIQVNAEWLDSTESALRGEGEK